MSVTGFLHRMAVVLVALGCFAQAPLRADPADTVLLNGRIVTLDDASDIKPALAISGDRIVAAGSNDEMRKLAGRDTRIVDLGGRTVIPGLIDSHIHFTRAGFRYATEVDWSGAADIVEALARLRAAAAQAEPGAWLIVAGGWTPRQFSESRRPTEAEIDGAASGHPAYVQLFYGSVLTNAAAREKLGVTSEAGLPPSAKFERNDDGTPDGWITGPGPAIIALYNRLPKPDLKQALDGTRRFMRELNRFGLTGVIDPGGHNLAPEDYAALFQLWRAHALRLRVTYSIFAPRPHQELLDFQAFTKFLPMGSGDDYLRFNGIGECVTWGMYNNDDPTEADREEFYQVALWTARQGLTLTVHWNNERSVHHLLDVFARVNHEVPLAPLRWSIAHLHDASDASLQRMKALGIGWLMQDGLYFAAPNYVAERGAAQMSRTPPIGSALRLGLAVGGGTDANRVMVPNPFVSLHWMLDGRTVDGIVTRGPAEIPSREQALRLYTEGSAWFAHDETRRGRLVPGMLADLAVLSDDYFNVDIPRIAQIESLLTMVGGQIVYAAGPYADLESKR